MRRSLLLVILFLMVTLLAACASPQPSVSKPAPDGQGTGQTTPKATKEQLNDQAFAAIQQQNWPRAIELARQAVALDPEYAQAQFNLGLALYRSGAYEEATPPLAKAYDLNKKQVEPGWFLALTLEQRGNRDGAVELLQEMHNLFPADTDVSAELARLGGPVDRFWPGRISAWYRFVGDQLLTVGDDEASIELRSVEGKVLWRSPLPGKVTEMVRDQGSDRVIVALADATRRLIDPQKRQVRWITGLPHLPIAWSRDLLYTGSDEWGPDGHGGGKYYYTRWQGYRLVERAGQMAAEPVGPEATGGQFIALAADGHTALLGAERDNSALALYRDGQEVRMVDRPATLAPSGHLVFFEPRTKELRVESPEGKTLMKRQLYEVPWDLLAVNRTDGDWSVIHLAGGRYELIGPDGRMQFTGPGRVVATTARHLIIQREKAIQVRDLSGNLVGEYPGVWAEVPADGSWLYIQEASGYQAHRLP